MKAKPWKASLQDATLDVAALMREGNKRRLLARTSDRNAYAVEHAVTIAQALIHAAYEFGRLGWPWPENTKLGG